ncbi:MAG: hypothetical protein DRI61_14890, partial [Chloroflexi bacterium]
MAHSIKPQLLQFLAKLTVINDAIFINVSWDNNDRKDAFTIADLVSQGKFLFYHFAEEKYSNASRMLRVHARLIKEQSRLKVRLRNNVLSVVFLELDRIFKDIGNPALLSILEKYPSPSYIQEVSEEEFIYSVLPARYSWHYLPRIKSVY